MPRSYLTAMRTVRMDITVTKKITYKGSRRNGSLCYLKNIQTLLRSYIALYYNTRRNRLSI